VVNVVYGCVTNSLERVQRYVLPRVGDRELLLLYNQHSLTWAYNTILNACSSDASGNGTRPDVLILLHDDLELIDPLGEQKIVDAFERHPQVGVVGVAGATNITSLAWWEGETLGHQLTDSQPLHFARSSGYADALEGSILALRGEVIRTLRFDEGYVGFHGYDVDVCFEARRHGWSSLVIDVDTHHHTTLGFKSPEVAASWQRANRWFQEKWML
jgi:GT2 family glycosyltransferase